MHHIYRHMWPVTDAPHLPTHVAEYGCTTSTDTSPDPHHNPDPNRDPDPNHPHGLSPSHVSWSVLRAAKAQGPTPWYFWDYGWG